MGLGNEPTMVPLLLRFRDLAHEFVITDALLRLQKRTPPEIPFFKLIGFASMATPPIWLLQSLGIAQIVLALASLAIPRVLRWREETQRLNPLTRQVFWTYAGYICVSNLCFGLLTTFLPESLIDGTALAAAVTGFIALWWAARVVIQFAYLDRSQAPKGPFYVVAEIALVVLFFALTLTYGAAALANLGAAS